MGNLHSLTMRDLLASVASIGTLNVAETTATDILRTVITEGTIEVPWSNTTVSYDVSGYTIASSVEGATLTNFYCNTGATLEVLTTGNTIVQSYISGSTIVPTGTTITEIFTTTTGTTTQVNNFLNVSLSGSTTLPTSPTFENVSITGNLYVTGNTYQQDQYIVDELFIGPKDTVNSWKFVISGTDLLIQTYSGTGSTYITKGTFNG
jgi:hypothetical protein